MIKYLGSKKKLIPKIVEIIKQEEAKTVLDLFSGTARVGYALQNEGINVIANDINTYAVHLARTYVQTNPENIHVKHIKNNTIDYLNNISPKEHPGWFTKTYCIASQFFQEKNGLKIEAIRDYLNLYDMPICFGEDLFDANNKREEIRSILLTSLIEAADRVDSTCGIQMAYLKNWAPRSYKDLELRFPNLSEGRGVATKLDAKEAAKFDADLAYIDPPYNQHNYLGNYHIWETICLWDNPQTYGKAKKRKDVKERKSNFNSKKRIKGEFQAVINNLKANKALISFNNEGYLSQDDILSILESKFSNIEVIDVPYQRYVGAKIGIHNQEGKKVGTVSHTKNVEYLFLAKN